MMEKEEFGKTAEKCPNTRPCPCTNEGCSNRALCCACVERHKGLGNLPFCLR